MISVSDTGQGMDEATRTRIFDPFFTTKAPGKGTGLGLSIVYGIIAQHGGQINVYSEPGRGTTFRIYLPIRAEGPVQAPGEPPEARPVRGTETILVAEDDEAVRSLVSSVLTAQGYRVILAQDGVEAVARYRECAGRVDLLLLDLIMPNLSGKAAFEEIRREWPGARALFASGYTADIVRSRGELDESAELVMKPIAPVDLLRKIRGILDRSPGLPEANRT
jgi:CheY-like chemotaxis protein